MEVIVFLVVLSIIAIVIIGVILVIKFILFSVIGFLFGAAGAAIGAAGAAGAGALAVGATALLVYALWDTLRDKIAEWLHKNNLDKSVLMEVLLSFDRVVSASRKNTRKVIQTLKVKRTNGQQDKIEEEEVDIDNMDDEIREKVRKAIQNGHSEMDITSQVLTY